MLLPHPVENNDTLYFDLNNLLYHCSLMVPTNSVPVLLLFYCNITMLQFTSYKLNGTMFKNKKASSVTKKLCVVTYIKYIMNTCKQKKQCFGAGGASFVE